mgnify:CR=1 FL=1
MILIKILEELKTNNELPNLKCPICDIGFMKENKTTRIEFTTKKSKERFDILDEPTELVYEFSCEIVCNNNSCNEKAIVCGKTNVIEDGYDDGIDIETGEWLHSGFPTYKSKHKIEYISIPLNLISIPLTTDKEIIDVLEKSYKLFWTDINSCGNRIRTCAELILTKIGIPKLSNLDQRIKHLEKDTNNKYNSLSKQFMAIKHFGNTCTHEFQEVEKDDLIKSYKVLENCLKIIFEEIEDIESLTNELIDKYKK